MSQLRIIPSLLLRGTGFYKTVRFKDPVYLGDPMNILRIFNEKEVDEIVIFDIAATPQTQEPNYSLLQDMASECFMPLAYGGGIRNLDQMKKLFRIGFEKVVVNSSAFDGPELLQKAAQIFGSQSVVVCIDVKKSAFGSYEAVAVGARRQTGWKPEEWAKHVAGLGVGEIIINSVDHDGTMQGYDIPLLRRVADAVKVPVIASGGAGKVQDFAAAIKDGHASACAAGAMFVFQGRHRAVLINVPSPKEVEAALGNN